MKQNKKGLAWNALIPGIIALFVMGIVAYVSLGPVLMGAMSDIFEITNKTGGEDGFVPHQKEVTTEENTVINSMTALIMAINAIVEGDEIYQELNSLNHQNIPFDKYTIRWGGNIELEETDFWHDYPNWIFEETFSINKKGKINPQKEQRVFADYRYGFCPTKGESVKCNKQVEKEECYCDTGDDYDPGEMDDEVIDILNAYSETLLNDVKSSHLAPVLQIEKVYNIELITYKDGKEICRINTIDKNKGLIDKNKGDLFAWGASGKKGVTSCPGNPNFDEGDGCDRDGDGIQGAYGKRYYGEKLDKVINSTNNPKVAQKKKEAISHKKKLAYFDEEEKIKAISNNGEGCLDSPTWLECPGIRAYFCGYSGYETFNPKYFHKGINGTIHNNAGVKFLVNIGNFTYNQSSHNRKDNQEDIITRDENADGIGTWTTGAWSYAQKHDLDIILGFIVSPMVSITTLSTKQTEGPTVYCYNAKTINEGPVTIKCDPTTQSCEICDFELPQNISKDYNTSLTFISGYGDPKYVVYYEAFPFGEEEAWILSKLEISLGSIVAWNLAFPIGGAIIKQGAKLTTEVGKFLGKMTSKYIGGQAIKKGIKLFKWSGTKATEKVTFLKDKVVTYVKSGVTYVKSGVDKVTYKVLSPKLYVKIFTDADNILKYASPADIKGLTTIEDVAEALFTKDLEFLEIAEFVMIDEKVLSTYTDVFMKRLPVSIAKKGPKYGLAYAAALAIALEDSKNEKFYPIGINNIGIKKPYDVIFKTGIQLPALKENASKYYIQLKKDKYKSKLSGTLLDQPAQRFFLASPCKANLLVYMDECNCWEVDNNSDIEVPGESIMDQVGSVPVLISSVDKDYPKNNTKRYTNAEKVCRDRSAGLTSVTFTNPIYKGSCISVKPALIGDTFCYSGSHTIADITKIGVFASTVAASIVLETVVTAGQVVTSPSVIGPVAFEYALQRPLDMGIDALGVIIVHSLEKSTKWPNH